MRPNRGCLWLDFGWWPQPGGVRRLLSWNEETGELAFWPLNREPANVLAIIKDEDEVRRRLDGWEAYNATPDGEKWLATRLEGCR